MRTNAIRGGVLTLVLLAFACGTAPAPASLSAGQWAGTTAQGAAITFTVTSDEILTDLSIGHRFNGCEGTETFSRLALPTAPNVICIPGPCSGTTSSYRAFAFSSDSVRPGQATAANGLFLPGGRAQGMVHFQ